MTDSNFAFRVYDEIYKDFADSREYLLDKDGCLVGVNGVLARKTLVAVPLDTLLKAEIYLRGLSMGVIEPYSLHRGICANLAQKYGSHVENLVMGMTKDWPGFSGSLAFPVGGRKEYQDRAGLWTNPKRLGLCLYLADRLREVINNG